MACVYLVICPSMQPAQAKTFMETDPHIGPKCKLEAGKQYKGSTNEGIYQRACWLLSVISSSLGAFRIVWRHLTANARFSLPDLLSELEKLDAGLGLHAPPFDTSIESWLQLAVMSGILARAISEGQRFPSGIHASKVALQSEQGVDFILRMGGHQLINEVKTECKPDSVIKGWEQSICAMPGGKLAALGGRDKKTAVSDLLQPGRPKRIIRSKRNISASLSKRLQKKTTDGELLPWMMVHHMPAHTCACVRDAMPCLSPAPCGSPSRSKQPRPYGNDDERPLNLRCMTRDETFTPENAHIPGLPSNHVWDMLHAFSPLSVPCRV